MTLPKLIEQLVEAKLSKYCKKRVPESVLDQVRMTFKIRGNNVTLIEQRPEYMNINNWVDIPVAQFRYDNTLKEWTLYWPDRNSRWHEYYDIEPNKDLDVLLKEVDDDPTCIFYG